MSIMVVGEAFGQEEEIQGKPFVGKSGQLLNKMLSECGINRNDLHITNVFMQRPPDNNVMFFFAGFKGDICEDVDNYSGKYLQQKFKFELDRLGEEINRLSPKLVISLGNVPYWCFTGVSGGITKARGNVLCETLGPVKLKTAYLPTFHPSFMLRNLTNKKLMDEWKSDIMRIKEYME